MRKKSHDFVKGTYAYGALERALGVMLGADAATSQGALRGRLKRFSTLGLPPPGPGKGSRRQYSYEEAAKLAIALLMQDTGLDPTVVVRAIEKSWPHLVAGVKKELAGTPMHLVLGMQLVAGPWGGNSASALPSISLEPILPPPEEARPSVVAPRRKGDHVISPPAAQLTLTSAGPGWTAVRDLTIELRKLRIALGMPSVSVTKKTGE